MFFFVRGGFLSADALWAFLCRDKDRTKTISPRFCCAHLFPVSDRWTASWRQSCGMRLLPGTRKPRRTRPCPCPQPANQKIWTHSSWCHWSRRPSQPSWPASTTWPSLRVERAKSTPWWPRPIVWTTCAAWTLRGTPGSEEAAMIWRAGEEDAL